MNSDNRMTVLGGAAIAIVVVVLGFLLYKSGTAKETGVMDPKSAPISHMQEFGKQMMGGIPASSGVGKGGTGGAPGGQPPGAGNAGGQ